MDLGLNPLRLSTYWDEVDRAGFGELDWQLAEAERAGRQVVLTVGMKAQGWPEFAIPDRFTPTTRRGGDVSSTPGLRDAVLDFIETTVERYRGRRCLEAWQVENEPVNPSGPRRWWIGPELLRQEVAATRRTDPTRPILLNAFAAFNRGVDVASSRHGLPRLLGRDADRPEAEVASLLERGDILGLDVYRRIGYRLGGGRRFTTSRQWRLNAARWRERAAAEGKQAWIVEAQAEPWEPGLAPGEAPRSCTPEEVVETVGGLREAGYDAILLWGVEHWLARDAAGDTSWLHAIDNLQSS